MRPDHTQSVALQNLNLDPSSDVFAAPSPLTLCPSEPNEGPARKRKRGSGGHPGVVLLRPDPARGIWWRARYKDPDSGRRVKETLPRGLTSAVQRREFCIKKSEWIAKRRLELAAGAARATGTTLADAVAIYFRDHSHLAPRTLAVYRPCAARFLTWAGLAGIRSADVLDGPALVRFKAAMINVTKKVPAKGGKKGEKRDTGERRALRSINQDLRTVRTIAAYLRSLDLLPRLTAEKAEKALEQLDVPREQVEYLTASAVAALLDALAAHDAARYACTREARRRGVKNRRRGIKGLPPKYRPVTLFFSTLLLTGMRLGEALTLEWHEIDLDQGKILIPASKSKTRYARSIDLSICPALVPLLTRARPKDAAGFVFDFTRADVYFMIKRLTKNFGAPEFTPHALRRTAGTYMTNAPGIFGTASAWCSARQLGHSVQIAERYYVGVVKVAPEARTLEAALGVTEHAALRAA